MKTRIIKETFYMSGQPEVRYHVQYKTFLFWHNAKDIYGYQLDFYTEERARIFCKDILNKPKKEIINHE